MNEPSETFLCPITHELMIDPVIDPEGNSYERRAIKDWLKNNATSPITRAALSASELRPNRGLKAAIDDYRRSLESQDQPTSTANVQRTPYELTVSGIYAENMVHVSIQPPPDSVRSPCDICCVVDTSGSMAVQAEIQNATNEKFGLSQLDLVKHALKTIVHSLQPDDRLSLVSFANNAKVHFYLTKMNQDGKSSALAALERLEDNGQTNLWEGLRVGLEVLSQGQRASGSNAALFLFTDGCPNIEPPRGHLPTLEKLKKRTNFTCTINTFGFGYELDSKLLEDISSLGNSGSYAFIPDGSFVGTIFVNAITHLLATIATNVQISVRGEAITLSEYTRWYSKTISNQETVFELGSIAFGQSKDILIPLPAQSLSRCQFSLIYDTLYEKKKSIQFNVNTTAQIEDLRALTRQMFRLRFVNTVRSMWDVMRSQLNSQTSTSRELEAALNELRQLENDMKQYSVNNDAFVQDLLMDLTGQVQEATSNKDWFKKWGVHFLPSITRAHLLQYCNNFKDPGVQHYGQGTLFSTIRDDMDTIFCTLPAPKPSQQTAAPIDMSVFNNAAGGCFYGGCKVRLMNGTTKLIKHVKPGDQMAPHGGTIKYVVKTKCHNKLAKMVILDSGLIITAWHPIRYNQQWIMPCSRVSAPTDIICEEVYNFALDHGHTILVNDIECVTLGHGFQDTVVQHVYYGTHRVIEDLRRLDTEQNNSGIIEISENVLVRDEQTGLVNGIEFIDRYSQQEILAH